MEFSDNLLRIRKEKGLSQEELAVLCNVSRQAISKWENGSANPDMENLKVLSQNLHVSIDELLGNEAFTKESEKVVREVVYVTRGQQYEYTSRFKVFGVPLVQVNLGRGKDHNGKRRVAKGIIAIGNTSIGIISIGLMSAGIVSIGFLSLGLWISFGLLALGMYAIGSLAIGYLAIGAMAIGLYSIGALSIGFQMAVGAVAYGHEAVGIRAFGDIMYVVQNSTSCFLEESVYQEVQNIVHTRSLPYILRIVLELIPLC